MKIELTINSKIKLNNGIEMPLLGLGTWKLKKKDCQNAIQWALEAGYRLIDTASLYGNEKQVGIAIKESEIPREEIFITSKVWDSDQGTEKTPIAFEKSMENLQIDYLDLYLIHWPRKLRNDTWKAIEKIYNGGKIRAIGVSNFSVHHLNEIIEISSIVPAVNQIQITPFNYKKELINYCKKQDIAIEAYSPLTHGKHLTYYKLEQLSKRYNKTSAQILIRWGLQHNFIEIPRSRKKEHIIENAEVFDFTISEEDMRVLNDFDEQFHILWDTSEWI